MTALTQERPTKQRNADLFSDPVAAGANLLMGGIVCLDAAGDAVPGSTATDLTARGIALISADNTAGVAGDLVVSSQNGCWLLDNDATDTVDRSHIGGMAYIVDDQTVASPDGGASRSIAGRIADVDADGVWVIFE